MKEQRRIGSILASLLVLMLITALISCDGGGPASAPASSAPAASQGAAVVRDPSGLPRFDDYPRPKMSPDGRKLVVAYLYGQLDQEDDQRLYAQITIEGYNRGWEIRFIDVSQGEEAIRTGWLTANNLGVDVIVVPGMDSLGNKQDLIDASRNLGIGVYSCDSSPVKGIITNFNLANGVCALELFYQVASDLNFKGNFCITTAYTFVMVWERTLPVYSYLVNTAIYPDLNLLDEQSVDFSSPISLPEQCYNFMQTWNQKYGRDMNAVFIGADPDALVVNESAMAAGRTPDDLILFTMGGSPGVLANMRNPNSCIAYNYAQSPELQIHSICELAEEIQILGYSPGDGKCRIGATGGNTSLPGAIIRKDNVPQPGQSVHSIFPYYDEEYEDGWWFWTCPDYPEVFKFQ